MSESFCLVQYQSDPDGHLLEGDSEIIEDVYVSPSLLAEVRKQWPLVERSVLEELGGSSFKILCFDDASIKEAKSWLENQFIRMIYDSQQDFKGQCNQDSDTCPRVLTMDDIDRVVERFRYLTNLINLFRIKIEKYNEDATVVIRLV
jgi:hypothetical protein